MNIIEFKHFKDGVIVYVNDKEYNKFYSEQEALNYLLINELIPDLQIKRTMYG